MALLRSLAASRHAFSATATGLRALHISARRDQIYDNILETIGKTPVVRLNNIAPNNVTMYVKCEFFNPLSSVKDRLAKAIILDAERRGILKPHSGMTVVEASSGNTGVALAMVCAQRGYKCVITMVETFSIERRKVMRALGAKVVTTPAALRGTGMVQKARELADEHGWFLAHQFENMANPAFHAQTTGAEILSDFAGQQLDYFVSGYGTGGTFTGVGTVLKAARPDVKLILSEPELAPLVSSGIEQERHADGSPAKTHPAFNPHPIQGWTPDFIPAVAKSGIDKHLVDEIITVGGPESNRMALRLGAGEGIFTGTSGGATVATAFKVAEKAPAGSVILAMIPDTGERYLSAALFEGISAEMDEEELSISKSTPSAQL